MPPGSMRDGYVHELMLRLWPRHPSRPMMIDVAATKQWFTQEVLPLERDLVRFIARHCRDGADVADVRQEVYERALTGARADTLRSTRAYIFTIARNVLIDRARRAKIVSFEQVVDIDAVDWGHDAFAQDRHMTARDELRRAMIGLEQLPPRCREVVRLRKVDGLSIRETADRMGVSHHTIERQLTLGLRALANFMLGGDGQISRPRARSTSAREAKR